MAVTISNGQMEMSFTESADSARVLRRGPDGRFIVGATLATVATASLVPVAPAAAAGIDDISTMITSLSTIATAAFAVAIIPAGIMFAMRIVRKVMT